jgi:hypothetical protein
MPPVKCVEPAEARANDPAYNCIVSAPKETELMFPHVDSCLAIAMLLDDGRVVGGHVGLFMSGATAPDAQRNTEAIFAEMQHLRGVTTITSLYLVGESSWRPVVAWLRREAACQNSLYFSKVSGGGVDVTFAGDRSNTLITGSKGEKKVLFEWPLDCVFGPLNQ